MDVEIAVKEHHVLAGGRLESSPKGRALPSVPSAYHRLNGDVDGMHERPLFDKGAQRVARSVRASVVNRNKLYADAVPLEYIADGSQVGRNGFG